MAKKHNNANILSLGARFISTDKIYDIIEMWIVEPFVGGRHEKRVNKLDRLAL